MRRLLPVLLLTLAVSACDPGTEPDFVLDPDAPRDAPLLVLVED